MAITNYTDLQAAIADELNRDDLASAIGNFISLCEAQTERILRVREMLLLAPAFVIDSELKSVPTDFLEARSLRLNTNPSQPLDFLTIDAMQDFRQLNSGNGRPSVYTVIGSQFQFLKAPDTAYTASLLYYQAIPRLSGSIATNWLLTKHPDIYFYGALLNSAPYLKDDARIDTWARFYQGAIDSLNLADDRSQTAASGLKAKARAF